MVKEEKRREEFISQNLGLVHTVCKRFAGKGIEYDDLYPSGCMGLIKAYDAFDENRGLCFSTYAVPVIMGCVRRLFRDGGAVKVSRSVKELGLKIGNEKQKLEQKLCREPKISEIADALGVGTEEVTEALCASQPPVSLTYDGEDGTSEIELPTISTEDEISDKLLLDFAMEKLGETERKIVELRYYKSFTQNKTAKLLNMTQVQVSRTEKKLHSKLRGLVN